MYNIDLKKTGERIKSIFDEKGYSVKDVQEYLGLASCQAVYKWINGTTLPTVDHLFELANLFQISVDDFLVGEEISKSEEKIKEEHIYGYSNYNFGCWGFCA